MTRSKAARSHAADQLPPPVKDIVAAAEGRQAIDLVVLDLRSAHGFADYFVVCSGKNPRQVQAIADAIETSLKASGERPSHVEGYQRAEWILLDYFDVIVHIFNPETRAFYALERLWGGAERIDVPPATPDAPRS
jgi:ribosome-associated protein